MASCVAWLSRHLLARFSWIAASHAQIMRHCGRRTNRQIVWMLVSFALLVQLVMLYRLHQTAASAATRTTASSHQESSPRAMQPAELRPATSHRHGERARRHHEHRRARNPGQQRPNRDLTIDDARTMASHRTSRTLPAQGISDGGGSAATGGSSSTADSNTGRRANDSATMQPSARAASAIAASLAAQIAGARRQAAKRAAVLLAARRAAAAHRGTLNASPSPPSALGAQRITDASPTHRAVLESGDTVALAQRAAPLGKLSAHHALAHDPSAAAQPHSREVERPLSHPLPPGIAAAAVDNDDDDEGGDAIAAQLPQLLTSWFATIHAHAQRLRLNVSASTRPNASNGNGRPRGAWRRRCRRFAVGSRKDYQSSVRGALESLGLCETQSESWDVFWGDQMTDFARFTSDRIRPGALLNSIPGFRPSFGDKVAFARLHEQCLREQQRMASEQELRQRNTSHRQGEHSAESTEPLFCSWTKRGFSFVRDGDVVDGPLDDFHEHALALARSTGASRNEYPQLWILKPQQSFNQMGISMVYLEAHDLQSVATARAWLREVLPLDGSWTLQEYVRHPLLYRGRKFDLRVWAAITSVDPLRIYMLVRYHHISACAAHATLMRRACGRVLVTVPEH